MFSANSSQVSDDKLFVEDVFSTYLYSGTSGAQSINNGIDTLNKGGLVWMKNRGSSQNHILIDTVQGCTFAGGKNLISNSANAAGTIAANTFQFDSTGFSFGSAASGGAINASGNNYVSWSFREAPKFFDVVTFTTTSNGSVTFNHSLGVTPGAILFKAIDGTAENWRVWHRSTGNDNYLVLNGTVAQASLTGWCAPTSTQVVIGTSGLSVSKNYVAYLFAHDTTSDGIVQCGGYTGNGSSTGPIIDLGWEPQFVMIKRSSADGRWLMADNMRGLPVTGVTSELDASSIASEYPSINNNYVIPTATGFQITNTNSNVNTSGSTYIYIAIRRGPMRTPTSGTSVFNATASSGASGTQITTNFPVDTHLAAYRDGDSFNFSFTDRLRGMLATNAVSGQKLLVSSSTGAEQAGVNPMGYEFWNTGWRIGSYLAGASSIYYNFRRAPSFFDEVCYTGNSTARWIDHNLAAVPELMIIKQRNSTSGWSVYAAPTGNQGILELNTDGSVFIGTSAWNSTTPTATQFRLGGAVSGINVSGNTYVAYLFASCPGVSKVGSYTGNGSSQTINCGFAAGARFVMIKRTDSTGDWYVWDTARGIVAGNDPHLSLNTTAAEVTTDDSVDTDSSGFVVNQLSATNINVSSAQYIYLAVA